MELSEKLQDEKFVFGALIHLYHCQTESEKVVGSTVEQNGRGFNALDALFLTSVVESGIKYGSLTPRQTAAVAKKLAKYKRQLEGLEIDEIELPEKKNLEQPEQKKSYKKVELEGNAEYIGISFSYDQKLVQFVKAEIIGRRWNPDKKIWRAPATELNVKKLVNAGFEVDPLIQIWLDTWEAEDRRNEEKEKAGEKAKAEDNSLAISFPGAYDFQNAGIEFARKNKRVVIGDEMGLGKTIQAIGFLAETQKFPAIVVCPASLKLNWKRELEKWIPDTKICLVSGKKNGGINEKADVFIINYDILQARLSELLELKAKTVIFDECHYAKNQKAKRTKAVTKLGKNTKNVIALSGTPITNRPVEFFPVLNMLKPVEFPHFFQYAKRYCGAHQTRWGWDFTGATNLDELNERLKNVMIRRKKCNVLKELPEKQISIVPVELQNRKTYGHAESALISWIRESKGTLAALKAAQAEALVRFNELKQLCAEGKKEVVSEWISNFLESGEKLVVMATHYSMIDFLISEFPGISVKLDGRDSQEERDKVVQQFQNDPQIKLFVGNIQAAGVGLTLTAASNLAFVELGWTPGEHVQAEDRIHRIGQEDRCNIYYLIADGTIENEIVGILDEKKQVLSKVLDGENIDEESLLTTLLRKVE